MARWILGVGGALALGAASVACTAELSDEPGEGARGDSNQPGASDGGLAAACEDVGVDVAPTVLRRLSRLEYRLTLEDLLQLPDGSSLEGALASLPEDTQLEGFQTHAALQNVSAQHLRGYLEAAEALSAELLADDERRAQVIGCQLDEPSCLSSFVGRFGRLAFRRDLEPSEVETLTTAADAQGEDDEDRFRFAIEALLVSPNFLYRVEIGDQPEGLSTLSAQELAARLSFALWGQAPSAELLDQADAGALDTPEGLAEAADALASDPRAERFFAAFFRQWLGFVQLRPPKEPPPDWDDSILDHMSRETELVIHDFAWGGRDFLDVLTTNSTRLSPELAAFYGVAAPAEPFGSFEFGAEHHRAGTGLLTHASLLSAKSDGDRISIRGNWLRHTFLCRSMHIPPEVANELGDLLVGLDRVEIVQERNTQRSCKGCHSVIDPIGIGFEQFDETGRYDPTVDIDVYGISPAFPDAPDSSFGSVAELAATLRAMPEVVECLTDRAFLYTQGRDPARLDACTLQEAGGAFAGSGHDFRALVRGLVEVPGFRLRRAPAAP